MIDDPACNDNRAYRYTGTDPIWREEYAVIRDWVPRGSRVIDLGCGGGSLLKMLKADRAILERGLEISASGVRASREKGLNVEQGEIDRTLGSLPDKGFDLAICNVTLQMVRYPEVLLGEMARIATRQIVSFPNFANLRNRLDLLLRGRMPQPMLFGYTWFNTGHLHQCSVLDVLALFRALGMSVEREKHFGRLANKGLASLWPNLFSTVALYQTRSEISPKSAVARGTEW